MARPGQDSPGVTRSGWQDMAWTGRARCGRLAGSGVVRRRDARIRRHGATWTTRRDTERQAWRRKDGHRLFRLGRHGMASLREEGCGWRGSALLRSDGTVLELLAWLGGRETSRHRRHGTDWLGRASLRMAGLACSGKVWPGSAMRGWLGSSWKRFARLASAGMAANATTW